MDSPDVYILLGDCLRTANVREETMPFVHKMADVTASRCYSPGTWTLSSHASLYAIDDPIEHQKTQLADELRPDQAKLPRIARDNGYTTSLFSENPTFGSVRGFHHNIDYCDSDIDYKLLPSTFSPTEVTDDTSLSSLPAVTREWLRRPNRVRNGINLAYGFAKHFTDPDPTAYPHHGDRVVGHFVSHLESTSHEQAPQLSFVNLLDPHNPHHAPPPAEGADPLGLEVRPQESKALAAVDSKDVLLSDREPPEAVAREFPTWESVYDRQEEIYEGQIRYTDHLLSEFAESVPEQFEDALVVVTGDHGHLFYEEETVEHHSSLHPGGIHVPLFVSVPHSWDSSERIVDAPVSLVDLARAVSEVVQGSIDGTAAFVDELTASEEVVVAADGPMWDVEELRETYDDDAVDELAARRVGVIDGDRMVEYECTWRGESVIRTEYTYTADTRTVLDGPTEVTSIDSDKIERWLRGSTVVQDTAPATDRLEQLGYMG